MKKAIHPLEYAGTILQAQKKGILLTTKTEEKVNSMTISWGSIGIEWEKPIFIVYVRENRFTHHQLEENPEFTINIPMDSNFDKRILGICGTKSGHDEDKIKMLGLTLVPADKISVPGIKELPLTLECKVIYKQQQDANAISAENKKLFYPKDVESSFHGSNRDLHTMYYGEIVAAYIIE